jgi:hypothetical protein
VFSLVPRCQSDRQLQKLASDGRRKNRDRYVRRFAAVIAEGRKTSEFIDAPPTTQALLIIGMCNWTIEWYSPGTRQTVEEVADHAARTAVHSVTPRPTATARARSRERKSTPRAGKPGEPSGRR